LNGMRLNTGIFDSFLKDLSLSALFGVLSFIFGLFTFNIAGVQGGTSDLREIPLLISLFYISHPVFLLIPALITTLGTHPDASAITTFMMHLFRW
jgi:hypothetical protein